LAALVSSKMGNSDKLFIKKMKGKTLLRICFPLDEFKNYLKDVEQKKVKKARGIIRRIFTLLILL
jgi:hypothetical protein